MLTRELYQKIFLESLFEHKYNKINPIKKLRGKKLLNEWLKKYDLGEPIIVQEDILIDLKFYLSARKITAQYGTEHYELYLPDNLKVLGSLRIDNLSLDEIPKGLYVRDLFAIDGYYDEHALKVFPKDFKAGMISINNMKEIKELPEQNYYSISAYSSGLEKLPNIEVLGTPDYRHRDDKIISEKGLIDAAVFGYYSFSWTEIKRFPKKLKKIYGSIYISGDSFEYLNDELYIDGNLTISPPISNLEEISQKLIVSGTLQIEGSLRTGEEINKKQFSLMKLPPIMSARNIFFVDCKKYFFLSETLETEEVLLRNCNDEIVKDFQKINKNNKFNLIIDNY